MSENNINNNEFIICVREPDPRNKRHILIHPVLLICNDDPNKPVSPESVIEGFKMLGIFQNRRMISISKLQVSKKTWNLLKEGVKDSEICTEGVKVQAEVLCS